MYHLLLLSGLLTGVPPWGACAPREAGHHEEHPLDSVLVTLNDSCREQVLWRVSSTILRLLHLDEPPRIGADVMAQMHEAWANVAQEFPALSSGGQHFNISCNETLVIQSGACTQILHRITLTDLGWQSWVLHPESFIFTECLGCHCHRKEPGLPLWIQECGLRLPSRRPETRSKQEPCCRPHRGLLSFLFLQADGSLVLQALHLTRSCHCQP